MTSRLLLVLALGLLPACFSGCASSQARTSSGPGAPPTGGGSVDSLMPHAQGAAPSPGTATRPGAGFPPAPADSGRPAPGGGAKSPGDTAQAGKPQVRVTGVAPSPAPPRTEPLVMENADRMEGFRSRGEYILSGKVRFSHGALRLETERAVWQKDRSLVYAEAGMRIVHRGAVLTSDRGSYDKNLGRATAEGRVQMRDSAGEVEASGHAVTYERFKHLATLTGNPEVRRYYRKAPDSAEAASAREAAAASLAGGESARKNRAPSAPAGTVSRNGGGPAPKPPEIIDTLIIRGKVLTFNDSSGVAAAEGDVRITRKKVLITCRRAEFHDRRDSLYLMGDPEARLDESLVKGLVMRVGMSGEEIKSLLVKGEAQAKSIEPATDTSTSRQSDVRGDSLFMAFRDKAIDSVQVFRNAKGSYFESDRPDFVNRMSGEYMVLRFDDKRIRSANVSGGAKSTYFHLEKQAFKGKNDAEGDTIDFAFKDGKVEEVLVRGRAKGTYFGEPQTRKPLPGEADSLGRQDTAAVPGAGSGAKAPSPAGQAPAAAPRADDVPALKPAAAPAPAAGDVPMAPGPGPGDAGGSRRPEIPWRRK